MRTRVIAAALMLFVACSPSKDQSASLTSSSVQLPTGTLDQLLAPIALYPDVLLAQILMSAQNPPKVAELDKWLKSNPNLKGTQLQDAVVKAGFDASYVALALFPQVVTKMAEQIAWTVVLGQSFTNDKTAVFAAIQKLRKQAQGVGTLKSTPQQDVETKTTKSGEQVIVIEPANPQVIYVPQYNTQTVYTQPPSTTTVVTQAPSTTTVVTQAPATTTNTTVIIQEEDNDPEVALAAGLIGFTAGIAIGATMNNHYYYSPYGYGWGYHGGGYMYADAWDDYYDARDDARDDWMDHREDLSEERTDRFEDRQDQRTDRTETRQEQRTDRQENRPEATQAQRDQAQQRAQERRAEGGSAQQRAQQRQADGGSAQQRQADGGSAQQRVQERQAQGASAQGASAQSASQRSRTGSAEARGYGGETARTQASSQRTSSDAFSGYSSGSSERAASSRGQQSRSSASSRSSGSSRSGGGSRGGGRRR